MFNFLNAMSSLRALCVVSGWFWCCEDWCSRCCMSSCGLPNVGIRPAIARYVSREANTNLFGAHRDTFKMSANSQNQLREASPFYRQHETHTAETFRCSYYHFCATRTLKYAKSRYRTWLDTRQKILLIAMCFCKVYKEQGLGKLRITM